MTRQGRKTLGTVSAILILLLIVGLVGAVYYFTNGFKQAVKSFYLEHDGERIVSERSDAEYMPGAEYRYDVFYLDGTKDEKKFSVKIVPNDEAEFSVSVDGEAYGWNAVGDLTPYFDVSEDDAGFTLAFPATFTFSDLLEAVFEGKNVVTPWASDMDEHPFALLVLSAEGNAEYRIDFGIAGSVGDGLDVYPNHIVFGGVE